MQSGTVSIISELMTKGTLSETLKELKGYFDLHLTVKWAIGIAKAMAYLHSHRLIHRDLKSLNVLVNDNLTVKLIGFISFVVF